MNGSFGKWFGLCGMMLSVTLCACSSPATAPDARTLTEKDSGNQVELILRQNLAISLAGNPTTGYTWEVSEPGAGILEQVGEMKYQPDSTAVGSGGVRTFLFHAVDTWETKIALVYHHLFEKDKPPLKTFDVSITVFEK